MAGSKIKQVQSNTQSFQKQQVRGQRKRQETLDAEIPSLSFKLQPQQLKAVAVLIILYAHATEGLSQDSFSKETHQNGPRQPSSITNNNSTQVNASNHELQRRYVASASQEGFYSPPPILSRDDSRKRKQKQKKQLQVSQERDEVQKLIDRLKHAYQELMRHDHSNSGTAERSVVELIKEDFTAEIIKKASPIEVKELYSWRHKVAQAAWVHGQYGAAIILAQDYIALASGCENAFDREAIEPFTEKQRLEIILFASLMRSHTIDPELTPCHNQNVVKEDLEKLSICEIEKGMTGTLSCSVAEMVSTLKDTSQITPPHEKKPLEQLYIMHENLSEIVKLLMSSQDTMNEIDSNAIFSLIEKELISNFSILDHPHKHHLVHDIKIADKILKLSSLLPEIIVARYEKRIQDTRERLAIAMVNFISTIFAKHRDFIDMPQGVQRTVLHLLQYASYYGNIDAKMALFTMYLDGISVEKNEEAAVYYLQEVAAAGRPQAVLNLAYYYEHGLLGFSKDMGKAKMWYEKAANVSTSTNSSFAKERLAVIETEMRKGYIDWFFDFFNPPPQKEEEIPTEIFKPRPLKQEL